MVFAYDRQAGLLDPSDGFGNESVGERVQEGLAVADGEWGEELGDVEEAGGGADGGGDAGCGGAGVVLGAAA